MCVCDGAGDSTDDAGVLLTAFLRLADGHYLWGFRLSFGGPMPALRTVVAGVLWAVVSAAMMALF